MTSECESLAKNIVAALREHLGENLYSCCVYGSAVRGNWIAGSSDLNVLILLHESNPTAHESIAKVLRAHPQMDPFILGREGLERSMRAFAAKFSNLRRQYQVMHGADPFAGIVFDPALERFLSEQALRNFRLRLAQAFVTRSPRKRYEQFLAVNVTPLIVQLSHVLRLNGNEPLAKEFEARFPAFEKLFGIDAAVLRDLLVLKRTPLPPDDSAAAWHKRVFPLVDRVVKWIDANWPARSNV